MYLDGLLIVKKHFSFFLRCKYNDAKYLFYLFYAISSTVPLKRVMVLLLGKCDCYNYAFPPLVLKWKKNTQYNHFSNSMYVRCFRKRGFLLCFFRSLHHGTLLFLSRIATTKLKTVQKDFLCVCFHFLSKVYSDTLGNTVFRKLLLSSKSTVDNIASEDITFLRVYWCEREPFLLSIRLISWGLLL